MKTNTLLKNALVLTTVGFLAACGSAVKTVPMKIQSDPLGAHVLFQVQADKEDIRSYDWIYLGSTPVDTRRAVNKRDLKKADAFMIRVIKEGYLDHEKAWTGKQMVKESKSKGAVFWNPRLVPSS